METLETPLTLALCACSLERSLVTPIPLFVIEFQSAYQDLSFCKVLEKSVL